MRINPEQLDVLRTLVEFMASHPDVAFTFTRDVTVPTSVESKAVVWPLPPGDGMTLTIEVAGGAAAAMPFLFRPVRSSLAESMAEVRQFKNRAELQSFLCITYGQADGAITEIKPYIDDARVGWKTHLVMFQWSNGEIIPAGFTNRRVR